MPKGFPNDTEERALSPAGLLPAYGDEDTVEEVLAKRQKTGGRLKGTPNKQKKFELMKTAQLYGLRAVATVIEIMEDESLAPTVRLDAANKLIEYGFGKPKQMVEHAGVDGDEIKSRLIIEFVGQLPTLQDSTDSQAHTSSDPGAIPIAGGTNVDTTALNSPFRNAQLGRAPWVAQDHNPHNNPHNQNRNNQNNQDITDVIHKTVTVPVFTNPWERK